MHDSIAGIFSVALTALGLSYLLQARIWADLYLEYDRRPERFAPVGLLMLVAGLFLAIIFNDWSATWPIFITAFGWLMAIEGALLALKPSLVGGFTRLLGSRLLPYIRLGGLLIFGLGCLLCWEFLLQNRF